LRGWLLTSLAKHVGQDTHLELTIARPSHLSFVASAHCLPTHGPTRDTRNAGQRARRHDNPFATDLLLGLHATEHICHLLLPQHLVVGSLDVAAEVENLLIHHVHLIHASTLS
jgi:hypothetical protein